jgi:hypothetical protein
MRWTLRFCAGSRIGRSNAVVLKCTPSLAKPEGPSAKCAEWGIETLMRFACPAFLNEQLYARSTQQQRGLGNAPTHAAVCVNTLNGLI